MKRFERQLAAIVASASILAAAVQLPAAEQDKAPAQTGAAATPPLPAGHPPVPGAAPAQPALPAGHPAVPGAAPAQPSLPAGHPAVPGAAPVQPALPAGHPPVPGRGPTTQPNVIGTLNVQAVQGTANGPAVGADAVSVEFYREGEVIQKLEGKLDPEGKISFGNVAVGFGVQPVVKIVHAGVEYEAAGEPLNAAKLTADMKVSVHESTETAPAWEIGMRHVMLEPSAGSLRVMEMISVNNPTDRAWVGNLGSDGKRSTFSWPLPAGATEVQIGGGFHECCTVVENGKLVNNMAILPGQTKYQIAYVVPAAAGKADLAVTSPASVKHLMVFAPDDGTTVTAEGMTGGSANMGGSKTRYFKAKDVAAGKTLKVVVTGIAQGADGKPAASATTPTGSAAGQTAKVVAGVGGLLIVLFGGAVMFAKNSGTPRKSS